MGVADRPSLVGRFQGVGERHRFQSRYRAATISKLSSVQIQPLADVTKEHPRRLAEEASRAARSSTITSDGDGAGAHFVCGSVWIGEERLPRTSSA